MVLGQYLARTQEAARVGVLYGEQRLTGRSSSPASAAASSARRSARLDPGLRRRRNRRSGAGRPPARVRRERLRRVRRPEAGGRRAQVRELARLEAEAHDRQFRLALLKQWRSAPRPRRARTEHVIGELRRPTPSRIP